MNGKPIGQWLGFFLLAVVVPSAGAEVSNAASSSATQQVAAPQNVAASSMPEIVYPYPPEALWQRLVQVAKTPPAEVTTTRIEEIFNVKFDDAKLLLWGDEEEKRQKKYFSAHEKQLKERQRFSFRTLDVTQFQERAGPGTRNLIFRFELFDPMLDRADLSARSANYCVKPVAADLEALGYRYSKTVSLFFAFQMKERHRNDYYMRDLETPWHINKSIILTLLPNECLNGFAFGRGY